ncbi:MAG: M1 family metallopeptidase [Candidatus Saccharimonadales bacterium]
MQTVNRLITSFVPEHYTLSLTINRKERTFGGLVTINGESKDGALALHAKEIEVKDILIDGKKAEWSQGENDELTLTQEGLAIGKHIVAIDFAGTITDAMHGMYPSSFEHDGQRKELIATQFESHHAREVFPCIDEPEAKATYDVTLTTEYGVTVLGNMPVKQQTVENNLLVTTFETTPRMSSYLLAWVVGEMHRKTATTKSGVEVNIWATPAQPAASLDFALDIAIRTIDFFDEFFGTPYPLPKADHVAIPDFSSGAMENWGLITYREIALLAHPQTTSISSKRYIATVIAHELSHQWFGNLVTMKWWNNLWLNESFATLMEYIAVDALHPEWDIWLDFSSHESIMALRRDALDGVQAVQVDVNHPDEISTLFDGAIVYAKGARLLRMLETYVGKEDFRKGLAQYFKDHAYNNTDAVDLWNSLGASSKKDVAGLMNTWISQPGYPVVSISETGIKQGQFFIGKHRPSTRLWPIPLVPLSSEDVPGLLETTELTLPIDLSERLNVGNTSHFLTHYPTAFLRHIIDDIRADKLTPIDRLQILHEQTLLARGGIISSAELIPLIDVYRSEIVDSVWDIISMTIGELKKFVETDETAEMKLRVLTGNVARTQFQRLGWGVRPNEPETDTKLRATILGLMAYSEDPTVIDRAKDIFTNTPIESINPELRAIIIGINIRHTVDSGVVERLFNAYTETQSADLQLDICSGLTSTRNEKDIDFLLEKITDSNSIRPQDVARWFAYLIRSREGRVRTWLWLQNHWDWIEETFAGDKSYDDYPRYAAAGLVTREQLEQYKTFFETKRSIPALSRVIELGITEIEARVDLIERDGDAVRNTLCS